MVFGFLERSSWRPNRKSTRFKFAGYAVRSSYAGKQKTTFIHFTHLFITQLEALTKAIPGLSAD